MSPINLQQRYLLIKLMEECSEVIQICAKTLQFGFDSRNPETNETNKSLLEKELGDVRCFEELLLDEKVIEDSAIQAQFEKKYKKFGGSA